MAKTLSHALQDLKRVAGRRGSARAPGGTRDLHDLSSVADAHEERLRALEEAVIALAEAELARG